VIWGHKPKPSWIKEEKDKPKQIKQPEARGVTLNQITSEVNDRKPQP